MNYLPLYRFVVPALVLVVLFPRFGSALEIPECKGPLEASVPDGCEDIGFEGCCDALGRALWCQSKDLYCIDCSGGFEHCGWNLGGYYDCGQPAPTEDPAGLFPYSCGGGCNPPCADGTFCLNDGTCYQPQCQGKECGVDPLGYSCGTCPTGTECVDAFGLCMGLPAGCLPGDGPSCGGCGCQECVCQTYPECCELNWDIFCVAACELECGQDCSPCPANPSCDGRECGEYCGINCGSCSAQEVCYQYQCCQPDCAGKVCGSDGCGGGCGECQGTDECAAGACVPCKPKCQGKECGSDGCGGLCGECPGESGICLETGICCQATCEGIECGPDNCGTGSCGECPEHFFCSPTGTCTDECLPSCQGKSCGNDGCGGECGECVESEVCVDGKCIVSDCGAVAFVGCCAGNELWWCEKGLLDSLDCEGKGQCGWSNTDGYYNCGTAGEADPDGTYPMECPSEICVSDCNGKECGDDGCGKSCGGCGVKGECIDGLCVAAVSPEEEPHDVIASPDESGPAADTGPGGGATPKRSGGCSASSSASGAPVLLLLLLAALCLMFGRFPGPHVLVAVVVLLIACSTGNDGYIPLQDLKQGRDSASKSDLPILDLFDLAEISSGESTGESTETDGGELSDTLPETVDLLPEDTGPTQAETDGGVAPPFDCDHIPQGPFVLEAVPGAIASEDLAFDGKGHLVGSNNKAIFKTDVYGNTYLFSPNLDFRAGLAYLPNGWLIVNDNYLGRLVKIDPDGVQYVLLQGLEYPNGITVDIQGWVYVTEHDANRVLRVHPYTGEYTVLTYDISSPNGIAFSVDYKTLYIGSFGDGWVYSMSIAEDGTPGRLEEWGDMQHTAGLLDGIAVDMCGNVYVCEYGATEIWRFGPDGQGAVKILDATDLGTYLPNLRFGDGKGWDNSSLYSPDGWDLGAWRINIGVPGPPLPFP